MDNEQKIELYRRMLRIRKLQLRIESEYHLDEMKTPVHLCVGQEAIAVGACAALEKDDYIVSNHRGHGHYLAKGGDLNALVAELFCRETGCSKGRGGSMHLVAPDVGHMGSSSIVGGGIPIGTGHALASKMKGDGRVTVVFFGDGAADEGVLYESINFAVLKRLPVVFILENNKYSVCSPVECRHGWDVVFHQAPPEFLNTAKIDGNNITAVYETVQKAVELARKGWGPSFIECDTYRMRGHAGAGSDAHLGYRTEEEIRSWREKCPVETFGAVLRESGLLPESEGAAMEQHIDDEIENAFNQAKFDPLPSGEGVGLYVFRE